MNNGFLSPAQVATLSNRADEINRRHCEARYARLGSGNTTRSDLTMPWE